ncbi:MAG: Fe-S cluster assembly ATPase SufC [Acidimicrobiia bacterium]|nr:Fe-S cluster assembly ATPase SufC [Acidimicrobiia bacterium]
MSNPALEISNLEASVGTVEILKGVDLEVPFGEVHAIMGPNGSGKSTLCHVLTGRSDYTVSGSASIDGESLLDKAVDDRSRLGLMQAFQYPVEVPGVGLALLMRESAEERGWDETRTEAQIAKAGEQYGMDRFLERAVNDDLSGGEKKRSEIFQMAVLEPKVAVLDEIDSGLDIDAVREVAEGIERMRSPEVGVLMITHYSRILRYVTPDRIHVMIDGRIVESGGPEIAARLEDEGYEGVRERLGIEAPSDGQAAKRPADFFTETPFDV